MKNEKWISIKDKLPNKDALYLIYALSADKNKPLIYSAWYDPKRYGWSMLPQIWIDVISRWMPLPEPPNVKE